MAHDKPRRRRVPRESVVRNLRGRLRITPLDRLIIDAVVDARQGVVGALDGQDLTKAVDEFVELNGRRHQSYFHAGFRDALFDLAAAGELPAQNEQRLRWYWTGAVQGWARSESWQRIADEYDSTKAVRGLGDGADVASKLAGPLIAEALWKTGRTADLPSFVDLRLAGAPEVHQLLLDAGTESLRLRNPGPARAVFAVLMEVGDSVASDDPLARHVPTVRRRMAHCLRLLGEHQGAEDLLRSLLRDEGDPGIHAMVHADLGLLKGRFALLDEVRIPGEKTARGDIVERLRSGETHFRDAVADPDATYASHGHYCLGVLSLADDKLGDDRFIEADMHLERAHAAIRGGRAYPPSLVAQTELYLGVAKAHLLDAAEIRQAARLVASGLKNATIPAHFIGPTVENLALSTESIGTVVGPLLESGGDMVMDALARTTKLNTFAALSDKLRERASRPDRRAALAATDLRQALQGYLALGNIDRAREVLDGLEHFASAGAGLTEFLELLDEPDRYQPAWDDEDAAVASARCFERTGGYAEALVKLRGVFHVRVSNGDVHDAEGVLARVRTYGLDPAEFEDLERRYEGAAAGNDPVEKDSQAIGGVRVLVVGGDETQARIAPRVRSKVRDYDPLAEVDFMHTGWTSNWDKHVAEFRRRIADYDAVVVMRYIRTTLGRHVRAICGEHDRPWRFCWSGGRGGMAGAVLVAAAAGRQAKVGRAGVA